MSKEVTVKLVQEWREAKDQLNHFKKLEMNTRLEICEILLANEEVGTHTFMVEDFKIKAVKKNNMSILKDELAEIASSMSPEEKACIEYKPSLSLAKYKLLDNHDVIDDCLLVKPATPSLTITLEGE